MLKYFKPEEFRCKCGCGAGEMSPAMLDRLDKARELAGVPFVISSGFRCEAHNRAVGGVEGSSHTSGMAADIVCTDSATRFRMLSALFSVGFRRIELAPTWIHVDVDGSKPQDVAFYQKSGRY
ncbi:D-Ala-D-Ala carboxypeptidase family metallohydrolase [Mailhella massiliensis]|uniref:D-Ala-D-Ala carboxypeptidase family metallohydrolase n=1 Tax=Mailhella massiliensis TaxID=1903261 RepID=UPI00097DF5F8|nr:D-Ala-D-Ala carboxypeptidase family metallohydrolase [Mailhella massiliensis]